MRLIRAARVVGVAAGSLALASATYQAAAEAQDRRRYQPPGRLVDVGGRRLHISFAGSGTPTVVIIPAMGGLSIGWLAVQNALAADTAVCVYDRPGLGWSDPAARWPTAAGMVRELHDLLEAGGTASPFILVGHSLGGLVARVFTHMYPDEVAGLVLVDSSHPQQQWRLPKTDMRDHRGGKLAEVALDFARPLGLRRMVRNLRPGPAGDANAAFALSSSSRRADAKELLMFDSVLRETGRIAGDLGDLPLAVITSSERDPRREAGSKAQRARSRFYPGWAQLQEELAALSSNSVHVVAAKAGHQVQRDDPDLVVKTITELVQRLRQS